MRAGSLSYQHHKNSNLDDSLGGDRADAVLDGGLVAPPNALSLSPIDIAAILNTNSDSTAGPSTTRMLAAALPDYAPSGFSSEITFISGVNANNKVAATSYSTWDENNPATYNSASGATKWGSPTPGTPGGTVYYYFDAASHWTATEQAGLASGLALWSAEANINFVQTTNSGSAQLTFYRGAPGTGAFEFTNYVSDTPVGSSNLAIHANEYISLATSTYGLEDIGGSFSYAGGYSYYTPVHEEGHVLGLGHGGPYNGNVNSSQQQFSAYDTRLWDLMSYIDPEDTTAKYYNSYPVTGTQWNGNVPTTPQILDILAAQHLYGTATSGPLAGGGVHFGFNTNLTSSWLGSRYFDFTINTTPVVTLWAGGTNNTLDVSGYWQNAIINLNPDTFSSVAGMRNNIGIGDGVIINNAIGGSGNDTFFVNSANDTLDGNGGFDTVVFSGASSQYVITPNGSSVTITDSVANRDGTDILSNITYLQFTDKTIALVATTTADIQNDYFTITRNTLPLDQATSIANSINSGLQTELQYVSNLATTVRDTTSAILSIFEILGTTADSASLTTETHVIAGINSAYNTATGWVAIGASIADSQFAPKFSANYQLLSVNDFINVVTQQVFGEVKNTSAVQNELSIYQDYYQQYADATDPTGSIRARGAFIADMLHQASDYQALHPGSTVGTYEQASEAFLIGLADGANQYGHSIFS